MKLLRTFPIMVMTLVMLSIVGFCAAEQSVKLLVVAVVLAVVSWYVTEGPRGRVLPRWVANLLVIAASITVIIDLLVPPIDVAGVLGRFATWLTIIKLYQRRTARDHAHLMALSLLLMLVGCLRTDVLLFGVVLVLYALTGLYVLLLYQLYAAHEAATERHRMTLPVEGRATAMPSTLTLTPTLTLTLAPTLAPTIGRNPTMQFRALAAGIGVGGLLLSMILFVIFPRGMGLGMMSPFMRDSRAASVSGYSDEIDLDRGTRISTSRRPVFELKIFDDAWRPVRLDQAPLLRGAVLDVYRNGTWSASDRHTVRKSTDGGALPLGPVGGRPLVKQSYDFHRRTRTVFALYAPAMIQTERPHRFRFTLPTQTLETGGDAPLGAYTIGSLLNPTDAEVGRLADGEPARRRRGEVFRDMESSDRRRVRALAESLLEDMPPEPLDDPWAWREEAARRLRNHLRSGDFEYTLDLSGIRRQGDPIVNFLFESRRGHCEFFASALAILCHSVGIDARVVTGYAATEFDPETLSYLVRESNAHAWVEIPTGEFRVAPMDPTPPEVLRPSGEESPLTDRLEWLYQRLEGTWNNRVIQFDDRAQAGLIEAFDVGWSQRLSSFVDAARDWAAQVNRAFRLGPAGYIWLGIVGLAIVIAVVALIRLARRYRLIRRTLGLGPGRSREAGRLVLQTGFYVDMLLALQRGGAPKPPWQPPLRYARVLGKKDPALGDLVRQIANAYYRARYAGRTLSAAELRHAGQLVRELEGALRGRR